MSIKVSVLGSGSRGNATFIRTDKVGLLIDCGLGPRTLATRLRAIGEDPDQIDAVLITHEHTDHVAGLKSMVRQYSLDVFMSCGTIDGSRVDIPSYRCKKGEVVSLRAKARKMVVVQWNIDVLDRQSPAWLEMGDNGHEVTVRELPVRDQIDIPVREQLIVELYSK